MENYHNGWDTFDGPDLPQSSSQRHGYPPTIYDGFSLQNRSPTFAEYTPHQPSSLMGSTRPAYGEPLTPLPITPRIPSSSQWSTGYPVQNAASSLAYSHTPRSSQAVALWPASRSQPYSIPHDTGEMWAVPDHDSASSDGEHQGEAFVPVNPDPSLGTGYEEHWSTVDDEVFDHHGRDPDQAVWEYDYQSSQQYPEPTGQIPSSYIASTPARYATAPLASRDRYTSRPMSSEDEWDEYGSTHGATAPHLPRSHHHVAQPLSDFYLSSDFVPDAIQEGGGHLNPDEETYLGDQPAYLQPSHHPLTDFWKRGNAPL